MFFRRKQKERTAEIAYDRLAWATIYDRCKCLDGRILWYCHPNF